jgi:hypothetical protein
MDKKPDPGRHLSSFNGSRFGYCYISFRIVNVKAQKRSEYKIKRCVYFLTALQK